MLKGLSKDTGEYLYCQCPECGLVTPIKVREIFGKRMSGVDVICKDCGTIFHKNVSDKK